MCSPNIRHLPSVGWAALGLVDRPDRAGMLLKRWSRTAAGVARGKLSESFSERTSRHAIDADRTEVTTRVGIPSLDTSEHVAARIETGGGFRLADVDRLIDPHVDAALTALEESAPLLARMARYHFGQVDTDGSPAEAGSRRVSQGKRLRPALALLSCASVGGDPAAAAPVAAAIELLHNFTLVHDDIQDQSRQRRHRETVWSIWGPAQAINAGDAIFAAAQLALYRLTDSGVSAGTTLRLADRFNRMTIEIVQGQVLDLGFEGKAGVTPEAYLRMIELKTAVIVRYAAWSGALIGGADEALADRFAAFGRALGLGFQVRDDLLGIWGDPEATGKPAADDIRRRKQSLPILILRAAADQADRRELDALFAAESEVADSGVHRIMDLLDRYDVRTAVEQEIARLHDAARAALAAISGARSTSTTRALDSLVSSLAARDA
jgi:geranylgeranyl diphosphate synthase, type I